MNCRSAESLFSSYVEDEISQEERRSLESHLMGCRRCSLAMREVRATMSLLAEIPLVSPSPHFDEDVYARIRSGEGLRPTAAEWIRELLAPARLRPVFMAGAAVGALAIAFMASPLSQGWMHMRAPVTSMAARPADPATTNIAATETGPSLSPAPSPAERGAQARTPGTSLSGRSDASLIARAPIAAEQDSIVDAGIQRQPYRDEIINDMFYLERGRPAQDPTVVPVNDTQGDGVFIIF